jgi:hypothetical protein
VRLLGLAADTIRAEAADEHPDALADVLTGNLIAPKYGRYARVDRPPQCAARLLSRPHGPDGMLLLVPSALQFKTMEMREADVEREIALLQIDKHFSPEQRTLRAESLCKQLVQSWTVVVPGKRERLDPDSVVARVQEICKGQFERGNTAGLDLEIREPLGSLEFRAEEARNLLDKEAIFQHSFHIGGLSLGFLIQLHISAEDSEGNLAVELRSDEAPLEHVGCLDSFEPIMRPGQLQQWLDQVTYGLRNKPSAWTPLQALAVSRETIQQKYFTAKQAGPVCHRGHPMHLLMFSDVGWTGEYDCSNCKMSGKRTRTRFGLHTCQFRCEMKPISAPCHEQLNQVKPEAADEPTVVDDNSEKFPEIRAEEDVVAMRLVVQSAQLRGVLGRLGHAGAVRTALVGG